MERGNLSATFLQALLRGTRTAPQGLTGDSRAGRLCLGGFSRFAPWPARSGPATLSSRCRRPPGSRMERLRASIARCGKGPSGIFLALWRWISFSTVASARCHGTRIPTSRFNGLAALSASAHRPKATVLMRGSQPARAVRASRDVGYNTRRNHQAHNSSSKLWWPLLFRPPPFLHARPGLIRKTATPRHHYGSGWPSIGYLPANMPIVAPELLQRDLFNVTVEHRHIDHPWQFLSCRDSARRLGCSLAAVSRNCKTAHHVRYGGRAII